ncbi:hypothetical protein NEFER03_1015 [Nematocida sp. LUAm3]|nr:hypothetical protein NEFER03_1015 [Nematocida sp. LUAm3]KAI5175381.1 hypothetical protein NEFER02_1310 [Nematocida sp. LUAm2]KAI5177662.1 hypothetical protein NEFER01_0886 [Nematocida sp. LUAm1]
MEAEKIKGILDEMTNMNLSSIFFDRKKTSITRDSATLNLFSEIVLIYMLMFYDDIVPFIRTYFYLAFWNLCFCALISNNSLLITMCNTAQKETAKRFILRAAPGQHLAMIISSLVFLFFFVYVHRYIYIDDNDGILKYMFKVLMFICTLVLLIKNYYYICKCVIMMHLWMISKLSIHEFLICACCVVYALFLATFFAYRKSLNGWIEEQMNAEDNGFYDIYSQNIRKIVTLLTGVVILSNVGVSIYLIFNHEGIENISKINRLVGSSHNIQRSATKIIYSEAVKYFVKH